MPNCFSLTRRTALEAGPVSLQGIDKEMCEHFSVRCDEKHWHHGWYTYIGLMIAMGKTWQWLRDDIDMECLSAKAGDSDTLGYWGHMRDILDWLEANFTSNAWVEIGRR